MASPLTPNSVQRHSHAELHTAMGCDVEAVGSCRSVLWPLAAGSQQPAKVWRLGILSPADVHNPVDQAFEDSLRQLGWEGGRNVTFEYRYSSARGDREALLAAELTGLGVDLFVTWGTSLALAVMEASSRNQVVLLTTHDPIEYGVVTNLAQPGGNVTGVTGLANLEILAKRLDLLKEIIPSLSRLAVLRSTESFHKSEIAALLAGARKSSVELDELEVEAPRDLDAAIKRAKGSGAQAIYVWPSGFGYAFAKQISDVANANGLPSVHPYKEGPVSGGLLAYAADLKELARRGAAYVDKILQGTRPGDLPVEQLSRYALTINLKTANALGLTMPATLLARADEVIE